MEPNNNKLSKEEKENVLMVLNEISQEYKFNAKAISMLAANVKEYIAKVEVIQEKRILLFPEHGAKEYYGTVLRWILYIIIATYGFFLMKYLIDLLKNQQ